MGDGWPSRALMGMASRQFTSIGYIEIQHGFLKSAQTRTLRRRTSRLWLAVSSQRTLLSGHYGASKLATRSACEYSVLVHATRLQGSGRYFLDQLPDHRLPEFCLSGS